MDNNFSITRNQAKYHARDVSELDIIKRKIETAKNTGKNYCTLRNSVLPYTLDQLLRERFIILFVRCKHLNLYPGSKPEIKNTVEEKKIKKQIKFSKDDKLVIYWKTTSELQEAQICYVQEEIKRSFSNGEYYCAIKFPLSDETIECLHENDFTVFIVKHKKLFFHPNSKKINKKEDWRMKKLIKANQDDVYIITWNLRPIWDYI